MQVDLDKFWERRVSIMAVNVDFDFLSLVDDQNGTLSFSAPGKGVNACVIMQQVHLQLLHLAFSLLFHKGLPLSLLLIPSYLVVLRFKWLNDIGHVFLSHSAECVCVEHLLFLEHNITSALKIHVLYFPRCYVKFSATLDIDPGVFAVVTLWLTFCQKPLVP